MTKDEIISSFEHCRNNQTSNDCESCKYGGRSFIICERLADDILALLKEQEPRILDWDEIKNYPVVYGEFRGIKEIYPLIITVNTWGQCLSWNPGINVSDEFLLVVSDEEDRRNTRCWNHMPTEEQRQAVPWDEQE